MSDGLYTYLLVIEAAKSHVDVRDLLLTGRLSREIENGYVAIKEALENLLRREVVYLDDGVVKLGVLTKFDLLEEALLSGSPAAWAIIDAFPTKFRKFDPDLELLKEIGMKGELFVLEEIRSRLSPTNHFRIDHISLVDDGAGYDISTPSIANPSEQICLEVKTTTRPGDQFLFYLSRNEFEKASTLHNWFLLLVQFNENRPEIFGHLEGSSLVSYFPRDVAENFNWTITRGSFTCDDLRGYLP